ncbi:response regulator [Spirulina sp. CCNP1310]|uniref:response regulator n=1 Tax=Spirulina sp. CCNP1310 TaxID=3110249 RepID=UPI002B1F3370|nr:response regulator [Spirulina sp. CCNP1310]MEA5419335.1 response regulator [Spirulina sp. CCNP1310]
MAVQNPADFLILVVDDLGYNLKVVSKILDHAGYRVTMANHGEEAIARVEQTQPDMILLDLMMPKMSGLQVCQRLKANPAWAEIPVIFLTASHAKEDIIAAFEVGAVDYVTKPFIQAEILARIANHLHLQVAKASLNAQNRNLKILHHLDTQFYGSVVEIFQAYLEAGCKMLGMQWGMVCRLEGVVEDSPDLRPVMVAACHPITSTLQVGDPIPPPCLGQTVVQFAKTIAIHQLTPEQKQQSPWRSPIASYVGTPILVKGEIYGVLCFADPLQRPTAFNAHEVDIVELMSQGLGQFIAGHDLEQERQALTARKDELLAIASHELRTPLTSINAAIKLIGTGKFGELHPKGQQLIEIIGNNTDRLIRLINNLLNLERLESRQLTLNKKACSVQTLINQALALMQPMAQEQKITLQSNAIAPDLTVWADPDQILQVLTNLINNGLKFSPPNTEILITAEGDQRGVLVIIADQGPGIATEDCDRIFERFQQVKDHQSSHQGTGLGLAICREIVKQHHGSIWVESTLGQGSRFMLILPKPMTIPSILAEMA